jgi:hypothetical protein
MRAPKIPSGKIGKMFTALSSKQNIASAKIPGVEKKFHISAVHRTLQQNRQKNILRERKITGVAKNFHSSAPLFQAAKYPVAK